MTIVHNLIGTLSGALHPLGHTGAKTVLMWLKLLLVAIHSLKSDLAGLHAVLLSFYSSTIHK